MFTSCVFEVVGVGTNGREQYLVLTWNLVELRFW
jgi:hypothetical protein